MIDSMYKLVLWSVVHVVFENNPSVSWSYLIFLLQGHNQVEIKNVVYECVKQLL